MNRLLRNKLGKPLFYWWIQRDLRKYMRLIETMQLKKKVEGRSTKQIAAVTAQSTVLQQIWNYGTFFMINTFRVGKERQFGSIITEEAELIVSEMSHVFLMDLEGDKIPLKQYIPTPEYQLYDEEMLSSATSGFMDGAAEIQPLQELFTKIMDTDGFKSLLNSEMIETVMKSLLPLYKRAGKGLSLAPSPKYYLLLIWHLLYQAVEDIRFFSSEFNINFHKDGESRCFYNMLNLNLHFLAVHGKVKLTLRERRLLFAASALHPLQDDLIDELGATPELLQTIHDKLEGAEVSYAGLEPILELIDVIFEFYPIKKNPDLAVIFQKLHEWQCISAKQKKQEIAVKELLQITLMKGGYAFALFGYIIAGKLSTAQFNHFFTMGAIFQVLDDLHDLEEDLNTGNLTVWTKACRHTEEMERVFNALLGLQQYYEQSTALVREFHFPVTMRRIELFGNRYDVVRFYTMNTEYFSEDFRREFEACFPFKLDSARKFYVNMKDLEDLDNFHMILEQARQAFFNKSGAELS